MFCCNRTCSWISFDAFWKFLWLENLARDFWGVKILVHGILGVLFEALGFWVVHHLIVPVN